VKTLIISGGRFQKDFAVSFLEKNKYDYVIAVDKGASYAEELNIKPDLVVGDLDSYVKEFSHFFDGVDIEKFNPIKDDTDTAIAIKLAFRRGNDTDIICGTGGRLDHMLGNIHVLQMMALNGIKARIVDECNTLFLAAESFVIEREEFDRKYVSFVPFGGEVKGLKLKGFKYNLNGYDLKPGITRCISNELTEDRATVEFKSGILIVINSSDIESE
jgi:thiamine pyrophosphokinase